MTVSLHLREIEYDEGHLALSALIKLKQALPGMSMTEKITLVIDVPGRVCY